MFWLSFPCWLGLVEWFLLCCLGVMTEAVQRWHRDSVSVWGGDSVSESTFTAASAVDWRHWLVYTTAASHAAQVTSLSVSVCHTQTSFIFLILTIISKMWLFNNSKNSHLVICYSWLTSTRELLRNPVNRAVRDVTIIDHSNASTSTALPVDCPCSQVPPQKHCQLSLSGPQHRTDIIVVDKLLVHG